MCLAGCISEQVGRRKEDFGLGSEKSYGVIRLPQNILVRNGYGLYPNDELTRYTESYRTDDDVWCIEVSHLKVGENNFGTRAVRRRVVFSLISKMKRVGEEVVTSREMVLTTDIGQRMS